MNATERRVSAASIARVSLHVDHGDTTIRWRGGDDISVRGDEVTLVEQGDELVVERYGRRRFAHHGQIDIELPPAVTACTVNLHHGDLRVEQVRGRFEARIDHGDVQVRGGAAEITLHVGHGDLSVEDLTGALSLTGGAGDVHLAQVTGPIEVRAGRGDLSVRGGVGPLDLVTGAGDTDVREREAEALAIKTGSGDVAIVGGVTGRTTVHAGAGDVHCTSLLGVGSHEFTTATGDLSVAVPRGLAARIEVSTTLGSVHTDLPLVSVGQRGPKSLFGRRLVGSIGDPQPHHPPVRRRLFGRRLVGSIGEGTERATLTLRTLRGDLRLDWLNAPAPGGPGTDHGVATAGPDAPGPPAPPSPPSPPSATDTVAEQPVETRQRAILAALAEGQLSVAEAEQLLATLDESA